MFGNAVVVINENLSVKVKMDAAFGQVSTRENRWRDGEKEFTAPLYDASKPALVIEAEAGVR